MILDFSEEENKKIDDTFLLALRELHSIFRKSYLKELRLNYKLDDSLDNWGFLFNSGKIIYTNGLYLDSFSIECGYECSRKELYLYMGVYGDCGGCINDMLKFNFLNQYENIKLMVLGEIEKANGKKIDGMQHIDKLKKELDASIYIDLPPTNNQHKIEVSCEDGRNVGVIDFGGRTIKIITDGDIVLVNRDKNNGIVKRK